MTDPSTHQRRPLISGNWKMNHNHFEAMQCVQKLSYLVGKDDFAKVDVSIHPPFTDIRTVQTHIDTDKLQFALGAQHCHWEDKGAFTGEVSPVFLAKLGVQYVICGHSERRELFGETDEMVANKVAAIVKHGMTPIVCVGETLAEREAGATETKVVGQVRAALAGRTAAQVGGLVIAYEPIWAIGTGRTASSQQAQDMLAFIRQLIAAKFDQTIADDCSILYGGSCSPANAKELFGQPDIDGGLIGGASLKAEDFLSIINAY